MTGDKTAARQILPSGLAQRAAVGRALVDGTPVAMVSLGHGGQVSRQ
ncbi:MAG: hypothetical protein H7251_07235 [Acetobacteraceae bacterium]|nr:hypothetical protein [Acetobacteraceae bacterium]